MSETSPRGRFVWYDLMTTDPNGAADFYTKIAGWGTQPWENSPTPYTMWTTGDAPIGGVVAVRATHLGLSNEEFDDAVKGWLAVGGGPGFIAIRGNRETRSGYRQYNMVAVQRTS